MFAFYSCKLIVLKLNNYFSIKNMWKKIDFHRFKGMILLFEPKPKFKKPTLI